jgi:very-short-patch-repair endonuclease
MACFARHRAARSVIVLSSTLSVVRASRCLRLGGVGLTPGGHMVNGFRSVSSHQRQLLRQRAQRMRHEPTASEWVLWQALRCNQLGVAFRRQVVLQGYITDFYASASGLIVEVDGSWHGQRAAKDARRDRVLASAGYRVLHPQRHPSARCARRRGPGVGAPPVDVTVGDARRT